MEIKNILKEIFNENNLMINSEQIENFNQYFSLLIEWNNKFNLTTITEKNEVVIKHFFDSIFPQYLINKNCKIIDVGSGAGFPSLPLKIMRKDLQIVMIDSLQKRVNFLNEVIKQLELEDISAKHFRAEDYAKQMRENFDYAVARAVANLSTLAEYMMPFIKVGGKILAYKSHECQEEIEQAKNAIKILGGRIESLVNYSLPQNMGERTLVVITKIKPTPTKYPRSGNQPRTKPL